VTVVRNRTVKIRHTHEYGGCNMERRGETGAPSILVLVLPHELVSIPADRFDPPGIIQLLSEIFDVRVQGPEIRIRVTISHRFVNDRLPSTDRVPPGREIVQETPFRLRESNIAIVEEYLVRVFVDNEFVFSV